MKKQLLHLHYFIDNHVFSVTNYCFYRLLQILQRIHEKEYMLPLNI